MMQFRISDTFTTSLSKLTNEEQKQVKTTVFDLQLNPMNPGFQFHRIDKSKDPNFWSIRAGRNLRVIVHKTQASLLVCYVAHHDNAYEWAERRKIEEHPKTGAAQIVEVRELVKEIFVPKFVEKTKSQSVATNLFDGVSESDLLDYGVPSEWLPDVKLATEDSLFDIVGHLPQEASEALLELATGGKPLKRTQVSPQTSFDHPDALRRFSLIATPDELKKALDAPWDKWTVFLHPDQRQLVEANYSGPYRVSGSAGTGKTIVALHRVVHLLRASSEARVLLTTFSETLANSLRGKLKKLLVSSPILGDRIDIYAFEEVARKLYSKIRDKKNIIELSELEKLISDARKTEPELKVSLSFLLSEWRNVIDAWQVRTWDEYKNANRLGRRKRLSEQQKEKVWSIFKTVRTQLDLNNAVTLDEAFNHLSHQVQSYKNPPYSNIVVDEAQDIAVCQLRLLSALGGNQKNSLFFAGDLGQRIFQQPFSWKSVGVDLRGRSKTLKVNYRTSHQIRICADSLLAEELSDVDQNIESRLSTISVFNGVRPEIFIAKSQQDEAERVVRRLKSLIQDGVAPEELGIFVRSELELSRAFEVIEKAGLESHLLTNNMDIKSQSVSIGTMHLAKGLEFKAVIILGCDSDVIPNQSRLETAVDESELEEIFQTERHLLYVACTRARDFLVVSGTDPASEFLEDLLGKASRV